MSAYEECESSTGSKRAETNQIILLAFYVDATIITSKTTLKKRSNTVLMEIDDVSR